MKILVAGASGLIGSALVDQLRTEQHQVIKLVRSPGELRPDEIFWDPSKGIINAALLEGFDAVVNLSGESIAAGRWTPERKKRILDSRVKSTRLLSETIAALSKPPKVLINASAIGYYGNREHGLITEASQKGTGFLSSVCAHWEAATRAADAAGIRVVHLRTGIVLSTKGGALAKMLPVFRWGLGGKLGSGKQMMSWIDLDDLVQVIIFSLDHPLKGPINAVSPQAVNNQKFTEILGRILRRPTIFSVPAFAIRTLLGEMGEELLLTGAHVVPRRLEESGFTFRYPSLEPALRHLL